MKQKWIYIALILAGGGLIAYTASIVSIINKAKYKVLSYQIQYLDNVGITLRFMFEITNPTALNLDIWQQKYDVFVAGTKVSEVTSIDNYRLLADNTSTLPIDVRFTWIDIQQKITPLATQYNVTDIKTLPVLIKGKMSAKMGLMKLSFIPFRTVMPLGYFLPF